MSWTPSRKFDVAVTTQDFALEVSKGNIPNTSWVFKFGYNSDVDAPQEDVWSAGGAYTGFLTSAGTASVVSTSTDDASAGTGAQTVQLFGLDSTYAAANEIVTLNGVTPVVTTTSWIRIYRMVVVTAGSTESNVGIVTSTVGGNLCAEIEAAEGQTEMLIYAIPSGSRLYLQRVELEIDSNSALNIDISSRVNLDTNPIVRRVGRFFGASGFVDIDYTLSASVAGPADIWISASAGSNSSISAIGLGIEVVEA